MRLQKAKVIFNQTLLEQTRAYPSLIAKYFLQEANIFIDKNLLASFIQHEELVIIWYEIWTHQSGTLLYLLKIVAINNSFITHATHERDEYFQITVLATDLFFEPRLQKGVKPLDSDLRLAFTV